MNVTDSMCQKQESIGLKKLDSMISEIVNKDSDEISLNIEEDTKGNSKIL